MSRGKVDAIIGLQRGDEGKGRFIDILAPHYAVTARYNGGANAGHTVFIDGQEINLHQVPVGIMHDHTMNLITHSSLFDPERFVQERADLQAAGREVNAENLQIGYNSYVVMPHHKLLDALRESSAEKQGSTAAGISYAARSNENREGGNSYLIKHDLAELGKIASRGIWEYNRIVGRGYRHIPAPKALELVEKWLTGVEDSGIAELIGNTDVIVRQTLKDGKFILAEGAQSALLDITRGRVPLTTSSRTGIAGVLDGLGIGARDIGKVTGVAKILPTHVGNGKMVSRIEDEAIAEIIIGPEGAVDSERGKTTGRIRHPMWLDIPMLRAGIMSNGVSELILTKMDVVERVRHLLTRGRLPIVVSYIDRTGAELTESPPSEHEIEKLAGTNTESLPIWDGTITEIRKRKDLPEEARSILGFIEKRTGALITMTGVGPGRDEVVRDL